MTGGAAPGARDTCRGMARATQAALSHVIVITYICHMPTMRISERPLCTSLLSTNRAAACQRKMYYELQMQTSTYY